MQNAGGGGGEIQDRFVTSSSWMSSESSASSSSSSTDRVSRKSSALLHSAPIANRKNHGQRTSLMNSPNTPPLPRSSSSHLNPVLNFKPGSKRPSLSMSEDVTSSKRTQMNGVYPAKKSASPARSPTKSVNANPGRDFLNATMNAVINRPHLNGVEKKFSVISAGKSAKLTIPSGISPKSIKKNPGRTLFNTAMGSTMKPSTSGSLMPSISSTSAAPQPHQSYPEYGIVNAKKASDYPSYPRAEYKKHTCSPSCKFEQELPSTLEEYVKLGHNPLILPLLFGWFREVHSRAYGRSTSAMEKVNYVTPCGRIIRSIAILQKHLVIFRSILPITLFSFDVELDIYRKFTIKKESVQYFQEDLAKKMFNNPHTRIPIVNCFTKEPPASFVYVKKSTRSEDTIRMIQTLNVEDRTEGCACRGNCGTNCLCRQLIDDGDGYDHGRLRSKTRFVVECNSNCSCGPTCENRTTTNTYPFPMMLYFYPDRGWGVRALCDIPIGSFIVMYNGHIISEKEQSEKNDKYLVSLDFSIKNQDASEIDEGEMFSIDGHRFGNVGRFFNHSCDPNMFVQVVHKEQFSERIYNVAFFTCAHIKAGEEMTWNYGYTVDSIPGRKIDCLCGARKCRGRML